MSRYFLFLLTATVCFLGCKDDDPKPENPEELITTLEIAFTPHGGGADVLFVFNDPDGDGGIAPVITAGSLSSQMEYHATVTVLNASVTPPENVTEEILDEREEHQFFFIVTGAQMSHEYDDSDSDGNPVGIVNTFMTGDAASGTLRVVLRHEPDKEASGVAMGDITNAGGETDIEVVFPLEIQ